MVVEKNCSRQCISHMRSKVASAAAVASRKVAKGISNTNSRITEVKVIHVKVTEVKMAEVKVIRVNVIEVKVVQVKVIQVKVNHPKVTAVNSKVPELLEKARINLLSFFIPI